MKGSIWLRKKGVFVCDVMKKRIYCTSVVPGKEMGDRFVEVELEV